MSVHLQLDLVGGISGDMFIGAMLDSFPHLAAALPGQLERAGFRDLVKLEQQPFNDGILTGTNFKVYPATTAEDHGHRHHSEIRQILLDSQLSDAVRQASLDIFQLIAVAEAKIHGKAVADIAFHEIGAWDSIADVVCAAFLIVEADISSCSVSTLPLGHGQVQTAHGNLPVPAPATVLLLEGFAFHDDGIAGERITPTGAAILRYLNPTGSQQLPQGARLQGTGYGFGSKRFAGISNVLRILRFTQAQQSTNNWQEDEILQLEFEIDDQSPEELATALAAIRASDGVIDLIQGTALAKKNRQTQWVRILAEPAAANAVLTQCFNQTSTLGIRQQRVRRAILERQNIQVQTGDQTYRVKAAARPAGTSLKVEMDDLGGTDLDHQGRQQQRRMIEQAATEQLGEPHKHPAGGEQ